MSENRDELIKTLVNEVEKEDFDTEKVKSLMAVLGMKYVEDPIQLLNNILKGLHSEETPYDQEI